MNETKKAKQFRTVFGGGYQKADVNEYIETMQAEFFSIEQTLKNTINHQRAELDGLRTLTEEAETAKEKAEQLQNALDGTAEKLGQVTLELENSKVACITAESGRATAEASLAACRQDLDDTRAQNADLSEQLETLRAELDRVSAEKQALEDTVRAAEDAEELEAACEILSEAAPAEEAAPIPTAEYEALKLKAEQYDRMSAHIGAIMLKANAGAEDILSRAKTDADAMVAEVNGALAETRTRAQTAADTLIADVGRSLGEISRSCREDIAMDLEELRTALRTLEDTVSSKYADISRKLDYAKEEMEQTSGAIIRAATEPAAPVTGN